MTRNTLEIDALDANLWSEMDWDYTENTPSDSEPDFTESWWNDDK